MMRRIMRLLLAGALAACFCSAAAAFEYKVGAGRMGTAEIIKAARLSVATITASASSREGKKSVAVGSGFVIRSEGYLITNMHVIQGMSVVNVKFADKREYPADVVGVDSGTDLALLKVNAAGLKTLKLGDSDKIRHGDSVIAAGNPFGEIVISSGIISSIPETGNFFQTDVTINPGNTGGPLFNARGEVIAVNTAIVRPKSDSSRIGFALPINIAMKIVPDLIAGGKAERAFLGANIKDIDEETAKQLGLKVAKGVLVAELVRGGPAEQAGIKAGDVLTAFDKARILTSADLVKMVSEKKPGNMALLHIARDGRELFITVRLGSKPETQAALNLAEPEQLPGKQEQAGFYDKFFGTGASAPSHAPSEPVSAKPARTTPVAREKAESDIDDVPALGARERTGDYAVVIGIEKYQNVPASDFSRGDAELVKKYLRAMGFPERNIQLLTNDRATKSGLEKTIEAWLPNQAKPTSRVFLYYSGHGAPEPVKGDAYIVPYDGDPNYLPTTGYSIKRLYESLGRLKASEVIVVLDSCFSGSGGRSVLARGARPLVMTVERPASARNMAVMTASQNNQISTSSPDKGHGVFTYYFLKAVKDGKKDMAGIYEHIKPQVEDEARSLNVEQSPSITPGAGGMAGRFYLYR